MPRLYEIEYAQGVASDLVRIHAFDRKQILDRIDQELAYQPTHKTRNKKMLSGLVPPWESVEPVWELRIRGYRVFYDVDQAGLRVVVRAIRQKPPHKQTEDII